MLEPGAADEYSTRPLRVCVAGATGWTGSAVTRALIDSTGFELVGAVARGAVGQDVGVALGRDACGVLVADTVVAALAADTDVMVDYTHPDTVLEHVLTAVSGGVSVVVGTSGLTDADYGAIDQAARQHGVGVIAAGNFSLTAALLKHFAGIAARHVPHWEIVDYAHAGKPDAPSGTARELAEFLGTVSRNELGRPLERTSGDVAARGATIGGAQVHSLRLPSFVISVEALFGLPNERLTLRHDAGPGADPYVNGALLAARHAPRVRGLLRGLDSLLFASD